MTNTEVQYFALLQAAIWDRPVAYEGAINWPEVMQLAQHHATIILLCDVASRMNDGRQPDMEMLEKMKQYMRSNLFFHIKLRQTMLQAVAMLREQGIEPVLLKGFSLAALYPNPALRQFGDIDLFVGLEKFHEACAVLRAMPGSYNWGTILDSGRHFNIEFGEYSLEIHRVSSEVLEAEENAVYMELERQGLVINAEEVELEGAHLRVPSKDFMAFFTFYHAWHHFLTTGVGWRQLCDIAMVLHTYHGQINEEQLRRGLEGMHLMKPWQAFGVLLVQYLGLPESEMPFYTAKLHRTPQKLYIFIMREGNFGRHEDFKKKRPKNYLLRKAHAFICILVDFFRMYKVFPQVAFRELASSLKQGFTKVNHDIIGGGKKICKKK